MASAAIVWGSRSPLAARKRLLAVLRSSQSATLSSAYRPRYPGRSAQELADIGSILSSLCALCGLLAPTIHRPLLALQNCHCSGPWPPLRALSTTRRATSRTIRAMRERPLIVLTGIARRICHRAHTIGRLASFDPPPAIAFVSSVASARLAIHPAGDSDGNGMRVSVFSLLRSENFVRDRAAIRRPVFRPLSSRLSTVAAPADTQPSICTSPPDRLFIDASAQFRGGKLAPTLLHCVEPLRQPDLSAPGAADAFAAATFSALDTAPGPRSRRVPHALS